MSLFICHVSSGIHGGQNALDLLDWGCGPPLFRYRELKSVALEEQPVLENAKPYLFPPSPTHLLETVLCSSGLPGTQPAAKVVDLELLILSTSQGLGLQVCAPTPGYIAFDFFFPSTSF